MPWLRFKVGTPQQVLNSVNTTSTLLVLLKEPVLKCKEQFEQKKVISGQTVLFLYYFIFKLMYSQGSKYYVKK